MTTLPLQPRLKHYRGSKERELRKVIEHNNMARRVVDHLNCLIANNPEEVQMYTYASIGHQLGLTAEDVGNSVRYGGHNGITVGVDAEGRSALAPYLNRHRP